MKNFINYKAKASARDNVEYVMRHCADCAKDAGLAEPVNCAVAKQYIGREHEMPSHGVVKPMFQENALARLLIGKWGVLSPMWINSQVAKYLSPFLGHWSDKRVVANLVTDAGKAGVASRINGSGAEAAFVYIAVGTGATAANAADTTLQTEIVDSGLARVSATASRVTTDVTNDSARLTTTFSVSGTKAVTEAGILNAGAAGTLLARQVFSAVNVVNGDSLQITWTVDVD